MKRNQPTNIITNIIGAHYQNNNQNNNQNNTQNIQNQQLLARQQTQAIASDISSNAVVLDRTRKIVHNGQEYMNLGEEQGMVRLYNTKTRKI